MKYDDLIEKKEIIFHSEDLRDYDTDVLSKVLRNSRILHTLNLSCNRITLHDENFIDALARNGSLRVLYLSQNKIDAAGAKKLATALKTNKTLQKIGLDGNQIGDEGAESLAGALVVNESLLEMSLKANGIGNRGAHWLASLFKENRSIRVMGIGGNKIGNEGVQKMAEALQDNYVIESIDIAKSSRQTMQSKQRWAMIRAALDDPHRKVKQLEAIIAKKDESSGVKDSISTSRNAEAI